MYIADKKRYDTMVYNRCGKSGLKLPVVSLGLWHNFGDTSIYENMKQMCFTSSLPAVPKIKWCSASACLPQKIQISGYSVTIPLLILLPQLYTISSNNAYWIISSAAISSIIPGSTPQVPSYRLATGI